MPNKDVIRLFWQESSPRIIRQSTNNTSTFCASECEEHRVSTLIQSVSGSKYSEPSWINAHNNTYYHTTKHSSQCLKRFKTTWWTKWRRKQPTETKRGQPMLQKKPVHYEDLKETTLQKFCWYGVYIAERKISFNSYQVSLSCSVLECVSFGHLRG